MSWLDIIVIAIVEGLSEFLPISSTGHMIIAQHLLGVDANDFNKAFIVNIQFGAILSVVVLYWKRFFQSWRFYFLLLAAFIPAVILGLIFKDQIDEILGNVKVVAIALLSGGIFLLFADRIFKHENETEISYPKAFVIGLFQCISMIPGVSRSAATIIGGMSQGMSRKRAAEFSFFLAVPTMFGASVLSLHDAYENVPDLFNSHHLVQLLIGNLIAFAVAMLAIRLFINFLTKKGFYLFGWYRIVLGGILLALIFTDVPLQIID